MEQIKLDYNGGAIISASTTDKILSIESGVVRLRFGGQTGPAITFYSGEKMIVPAGLTVYGYASEQVKSATVIVGPFGV